MVMFRNNGLPGASGRIVVIGGGAAGALAALHLLDAAAAGEVVVVEPARDLGFGVAYRTRHPLHLLNVPAGRMSAFPDRPGDFVSWLDGTGPEAAAAFVSRRLFGEYLRDRLAAAGSGEALAHVRSEAVGIEVESGGVVVSLADGSTLEAERALLAIGQQQERPRLGSAALEGEPRLVADPWAAGALEQIRHGDSVVLLGTGLTMVDVALELAERGVTLTAVSRRGLLPHAHPARPSTLVPAELPPGGRLRDLVRSVRAAAAAREHWSAAVDALRPLTQDLWQGLTAVEQAQFLRHVAPHWNVHRHRMPPPSATALQRLRDQGRLRTLAAGVLRVTADPAGLAVELRSRGDADTTILHVDHVVNCTGPRSQLLDEPPQLARALLDAGLARVDAHELGLDTDGDGALIDSDGATSERLFAIGSLRRGTLLESTAIPELRVQAQRFAALGARAVATNAGH